MGASPKQRFKTSQMATEMFASFPGFSTALQPRGKCHKSPTIERDSVRAETLDLAQNNDKARASPSPRHVGPLKIESGSTPFNAVPLGPDNTQKLIKAKLCEYIFKPSGVQAS